MKFSESWLREWVNPDWDTQRLSEELSLAGLEVDGLEPVAGEFSQVVVGQVEAMEKHPDADKLNVTQVAIGNNETVQIVCGAKNVRVGMKACCALVGAVLPGNFKIKKAKLRGVESHGMLCGANELGLPDDGVDGLHELAQDAPVGKDVREYLNLDDTIIDVDLTPNRADCFSVQGIARDVHAVSGAAMKTPFAVEALPPQGECTQDIVVQEPQACPKYLGCVVSNFNSQAQTPAWMVQKLQRSGLRSLSLVVDITNYVLLELGQPMHAFDLDRLQGAVQVRFAHQDERLVTLDDKTITLQPDTLVIADQSGPIALAGIMGGLTTAVTSATQTIFFECAHFAPLAITGKARQYGLHTDSSMRFERGVDPLLPEKALNRALNLFTQIAGGEVSAVSSHIDQASLPAIKPIFLQRDTIAKRLGIDIKDARVEQIFNDLGFAVKAVDSGWQMTPPSFRFDMAIEMDLIEEVGRIFGYNNLPETPVHAPMTLNDLAEDKRSPNTLKNVLVQRGYNEVVTYSFVAAAKQTEVAPHLEAITLKNPISDDMSTMRTSLFPGLLQSLSYNQKRQQPRVRLFEAGLVFYKDETDPTGAQQIPMLGGAIVGSAQAPNWNNEERPVDFYDIKGDCEALLANTEHNLKITFGPCDHPALHPGQSAQILLNGEEVGVVGQLHPKLVKTFAVQGKVFLFEIQQEVLLQTQVPKAHAVSKYPEVQRDLAFVMAQERPVQDLINAIKTVATDLLQGIQVFDVYQGAGLPEGQKSIALSLSLQHPDKTLQDEDVDDYVKQVLAAAQTQANAQLR